MKEFLSFHSTNRFLQAVKSDLHVDEYFVECRALGIIGKLITAPLWRYLVLPSNNFADAVVVYRQLADSLACYAEDASSLVDGSARAFPGANVHTSSVLDRLLTPTDHDSLLKKLLQLLCTCFHAYMQREWACYLDADAVATPDGHETAGLPKVTVISERDFAQLDRFMREKPRATTLAVESFIMLGNNKTVAWLAAKTQEERGAILQAARSLVPKHKELACQTRIAIQKHKATELKRQQEQAEKREQKRLQEVQQVTVALAAGGGLWTTDEQMATTLESIATVGKKRDAIKCQIRFREKVLQQKASRQLFAFSKDGKALSLEQLISNLKLLMAAIPSGQAEDNAGSTNDESGDDTTQSSQWQQRQQQQRQQQQRQQQQQQQQSSQQRQQSSQQHQQSSQQQQQQSSSQQQQQQSSQQ